MYSSILQEPIIITDDMKTDDGKKLQQLLEAKKSFETNLFETFNKNEKLDEIGDESEK